MQVRIELVDEHDSAGRIDIRKIPQEFAHDVHTHCDHGLVALAEIAQRLLAPVDLEEHLPALTSALRQLAAHHCFIR